MSPRQYRLGKRAAGAAETRARIIEAAHTLFAGTGFHRVSVDAVAEQARVGRTTVFEQFGSKLKLLQAVEQEVSRRAGVDALIQALSVPDARAALRAAFHEGAQVWAREHAMFQRLFGLALVDGEVRKVMQEKDAKRRLLVEALCSQLEAQGQLRATRAHAFQVLWLLTSFEAFDKLYAESRDPTRVAEVLEGLALTLVKPG